MSYMSVTYSCSVQKLFITTQTGAVWEYAPVTQEMYEQILNSADTEKSIHDLIHKNMIAGVRKV
jgi:hypothetical protein